MATWIDLETQAPDLAALIRSRLTATKHHVLATVRADGSPRVSGTEIDFQGPDLVIGSMWGAVKAKDLQRDHRFALHTNPGDGSMEGGDAKLAGRALELTGAAQRDFEARRHPPTPFHLFRLDLDQVVHTSVHPDGDRLVIRTWRAGQPVQVVERS